MPATTSPAWEAVKAARAAAWQVIDRMVEDADGFIEGLEAVKLSRPVAGAGEWDWYFGLARAERARILSRWTSDFGQSPDAVTGAVGSDHDDLMVEWVRATRIIDAAASLRIRKYHGYVPGTKALGGRSIDVLFPGTGYELTALFAAQPACTDYIESLGEGYCEEEEAMSADEILAFMEEALG